MGNSSSSSSSTYHSASRYGQPTSSYPNSYPAPSARQPTPSYPDTYPQSTPSYADAYPPPAANQPQTKNITRRYSKKYSLINDNYNSLQEVQQALGQAGLESSNLIVGIDFTKSNEWTGKKSYGGRSLHAIGQEPNPYEKAISIVGQTLSPFDEDNLIPCFGFGDASTHDKHVFSFFSDQRPCEGFEEALNRYRTIVPHLRLAGPTSFAPIIDAAVNIVEESGGQYHVLIIIADGQVTRSSDTLDGHLSPQEKATVDAIVNASAYPLSIVLVGVGDGPWDMMRKFDDNLPSRSFDNFQFVNFTQIMQRSLPPQMKEAQFALAALMEIPQQYKATLELGILGRSTGNMRGGKPLPPPRDVLRADANPSSGYVQQPPGLGYSNSPSLGSRAPEIPASRSGSSYMYPPTNQPNTNIYGYDDRVYPPSATAAGPAAPSYQARSLLSTVEDMAGTETCPVCLTDKKDMAFGCGHQTCRQCSESLTSCPICRQEIKTRIRLY